MAEQNFMREIEQDFKHRVETGNRFLFYFVIGSLLLLVLLYFTGGLNI